MHIIFTHRIVSLRRNLSQFSKRSLIEMALWTFKCVSTAWKVQILPINWSPCELYALPCAQLSILLTSEHINVTNIHKVISVLLTLCGPVAIHRTGLHVEFCFVLNRKELNVTWSIDTEVHKVHLINRIDVCSVSGHLYIKMFIFVILKHSVPTVSQL
jgi:hypothetical protein